LRLVDLSGPIRPSPPNTIAPLRTELAYSGHEEGAAQIEQMFGVPRELLRDGEGWSNDEFTKFGTHNSTHVDAPWHYNSTIQGRPAQKIDELALEWFHSRGVVLEMSHKEDGDAVTAGEVEAELDRIEHSLEPLDIVLVRTGRDRFVEEPDYIARGPGVSAEATHWLFEHGVRVMGIDAWGWDSPLHLQAQRALESKAAGVFWEAHQADLPYPQTGFTLSCFPLRIEGASGSPVRAVAILP